MSDKAEPASKKSNWLKAVFGTLAGLLSGALGMYLSPLLDKVVKPGRPVANFAVERQELTATFHNRSTGANQGWWDFGDGAPLEPLDPQQELITHTYAAPGTYSAKLSVRNLFGDESDRTVQIALEPARREAPLIQDLSVDEMSRGSYAPATFRVKGQAKNAELCVWHLGEDRPLEFSNENLGNLERMVTFDKPGGYTIRLVAVNGNQGVAKEQVVWVEEPPKGTCAVVLTVSDAATCVDTVETIVPVSEAFPPGAKAAVHKIDRLVPARSGYEIKAARLQPVTDAGARNLRLQVAADKRSVKLLGELPRASGNGSSASMLVKVLVTQEKRAPAVRAPVTVAATLAVPGTTLLTLPALPQGWVDAQRHVRLELRENDRSAWQGSQLPRGTPVQLGGRRYVLSAIQSGAQVRVELADLSGTAAANKPSR